MTAEDETAFVRLMGTLLHAYGREIDEGLVDLYFNVLADYPFGSVAEAMYQHLADPDKGQFVPKPADVIRHIQGGTGTRALAAWDEALRAVERFGHGRTVTFEDPLILACIDRMGGWMAFCGMPEEAKPFRQREFIERYSAYVTHPPADIPRSLAGFFEVTNGALGWGDDPRAVSAARPCDLREPRFPMLPQTVHSERRALSCQELHQELHGDGPPAPIRRVTGLSAVRDALPARFLSEEAAEAERERQKAEAARRFGGG